MAHKFADSCVTSGLEDEPYWRDVGTIDAFWQANIDLTDFVPKLDIYDNSWPIWTYSEIVPPAKFIHDEEGRRGMAVSSLVSGDCIVSGSQVRNSLLFTGVRTHSWSSLEYVVALPRVTVHRKAELTNCVIDRGGDPRGAGRRPGWRGRCEVVPPHRLGYRADHPGDAGPPGGEVGLGRWPAGTRYRAVPAGGPPRGGCGGPRGSPRSGLQGRGGAEWAARFYR
jgi:hypothetical protein